MENNIFSIVMAESFNFSCNMIIYWLKSWGDYVSPPKKSTCDTNAQTSQNIQMSQIIVC
jgi:hypothetical protein